MIKRILGFTLGLLFLLSQGAFAENLIPLSVDVFPKDTIKRSSSFADIDSIKTSYGKNQTILNVKTVTFYERTLGVPEKVFVYYVEFRFDTPIYNETTNMLTGMSNEEHRIVAREVKNADGYDVVRLDTNEWKSSRNYGNKGGWAPIREIVEVRGNSPIVLLWAVIEAEREKTRNIPKFEHQI